jgi:Uncharacterised protein family UPF0047
MKGTLWCLFSPVLLGTPYFFSHVHFSDGWLQPTHTPFLIALYRTGEDNGDAHLKRQVMGREVVVAVTGGKLDFGPREQIFYEEFDGRRKKRVLFKIIGE